MGTTLIEYTWIQFDHCFLLHTSTSSFSLNKWFYSTGELERIIQILTLALGRTVLPLPLPIPSLIKIYPLRFVPISSGTKWWSYAEASVHLHSYGSLSLHFIVWLQLLQVPIPSIPHQDAGHDTTSLGIVKRMTSKSRWLATALGQQRGLWNKFLAAF